MDGTSNRDCENVGKKNRKKNFTALRGKPPLFCFTMIPWKVWTRHCSFSHSQENHEQDSKQGTKDVISKNYYFAWNWFLSCVSELCPACFFGYYLVCVLVPPSALSMILFSSYRQPRQRGLLLLLLHRQGNWGLRRLRTVSQITQLGRWAETLACSQEMEENSILPGT